MSRTAFEDKFRLSVMEHFCRFLTSSFVHGEAALCRREPKVISPQLFCYILGDTRSRGPTARINNPIIDPYSRLNHNVRLGLVISLQRQEVIPLHPPVEEALNYPHRDCTQ